MATENYNYKYTIQQVNIEQGTILVNFVPEDANLSPVSLNSYLIPVSYMDIRDANNELVYATQDEVPFQVHLDNTVNNIAPLKQWKTQYILLENSTGLSGYQNNVSIDASTVVLIPQYNRTPVGPLVTPAPVTANTAA